VYEQLAQVLAALAQLVLAQLVLAQLVLAQLESLQLLQPVPTLESVEFQP
jgi:hypothetical protein